jgi:hypothetical protein
MNETGLSVLHNLPDNLYSLIQHECLNPLHIYYMVPAIFPILRNVYPQLNSP